MQYALLNVAGTEVLEIRDYPVELNPDDVALCDDGNPMLRPYVVTEAAPETWQITRAHRDEIAPDRVTKIWIYEDKPLTDVHAERLVQIEQLFLGSRARGFEFSTHRYSLLQQSTERMDLVRRAAYDPARLRDVNGAATPLDATEVNNWLAAGDDVLAALYLNLDNHITALLATTTPEAAATYDISTGWPMPDPTPEPEP